MRSISPNMHIAILPGFNIVSIVASILKRLLAAAVLATPRPESFLRMAEH